jgi:hypothetical protein
LDTLLITDAFGNERAIIYIGGRMKRYYKISYDDKEGFPVLPHGDRLSELYLLQAHRVDHGEINTMVMMSRKKVCIMQAAMIKNACFRCRLLWKQLQGQEIAPMTWHRMGPHLYFQHTALDLFGPLEFKDMVKKRVTGKGWGVLFVCTTSSAIHIEIS